MLLKQVCGKTGDKFNACIKDHLVQPGGPLPTVPACSPASLATTAIFCHGKARVRRFAHSALDPLLFKGH